MNTGTDRRIRVTQPGTKGRLAVLMSRIARRPMARLPIGVVVVALLASLFGPLGAVVSAEEAATEPAAVSEPVADPAAEPVAEPAAEPAPETPKSSLIVKMVSGLSESDQQAAIALHGGTEVSAIPALRLHVVEVADEDLYAAKQGYDGDRRVEAVELDRTRAAEAVVSDPAYADQWALPKIGWDSVYGSVTPSGSATIAVLDTGVAPVADLDGRLVSGYTAFPGTDPQVDANGHGTALATIAAAGADNGVGIAGVGYAGVNVMPVRVLDDSGLGQDSDIIAGVVHAADHGADVILMAFSNPGFSQSLQDAIDYAWSKGAVLVAATGNDGSATAAYPAGDAKVVGVSATDQNDALWSGSNHGPAAFLGAPGVQIGAVTPGGGTTSITGTSASAAIVAGSAALIAANDSSASNGVIVGRLARTADAAGTADQTGNGRVNLARAVADVSTEAVVPAGAAPSGDGGPFVGPYVAATTATVTGTVTSSVAPNAPISGASVTVVCSPAASCNSTSYVVTTNASGVYTATPNWGPGTRSGTVSVTATGYASPALASSWGPLDGNQTATVNFSLTPSNSAPTISNIADQNTNEDTPTGGIAFTVGDAQTPPGSLVVTGSSDNTALVPDANIVFGGSGANRTVTVTPVANASGTATITVTVTDADSATGTDTFVLTVNALNDAPTCSATTLTTDEDTPGSTAPVCTDVDSSSLTYAIVDGAANGTATVEAGNLAYSPNLNHNGVDSFTYKANDGDADSNTSTVTVTVTPVNDAPVAAANLPSQTGVQYSDAISKVTITATRDEESPASAVLASILHWNVSGGSSQTIPPLGNLSLAQVGPTTAFPLNWELTGKAMVAAGTYFITIRVTDGTTPTDILVTIVVDKEGATLEYTGDSFKNTASPTTNSAVINLSAVVREARDGALGDKLNTTMIKFAVTRFNAITPLTLPDCDSVAVIASSEPGTGLASCSVTIPADADPYTVTISLLPNGYYTGLPEEAVLAVTIPGAGMTSGGGWIHEPNNQTKSSFGYTVKRLKNGSVQGNSLYIYRARKDIGNGLGVREYNFRVKSNSWQGGGLSMNSGCNTTVSPFSNCTGTFSGKANVTAIDRITGLAYPLGGGYSYRVDVTDLGEPGSKAAPSPDTYAIKVWSSAGTYYQLYNGTAPDAKSFPQLPINGGNIQVRP